MVLKLTKQQIKECFDRQSDSASQTTKDTYVEIYPKGDTTVLHAVGPPLDNVLTSLCPYCGKETGPGADMHRRCFKAATPGERYLVLSAQVEVMAERSGVSVEEMMEVYQHEVSRSCDECGRKWRLVEEGWECPACVNV